MAQTADQRRDARRQARRREIVAAIGDDLGELLVADTEYRESQDHLAELLRFRGWRCTPPAPTRKGR
jgi:hypothetical protein